MRTSDSTPGFTLIEVLVTLALISLLATLVTPLTMLTVKRNQEVELRQALREIREGLDAYKQAVDAGRIASRPGDSGYPPNLDALVKGVEDIRTPQKTLIYFMRRIPRDPFAERKAVSTPADDWGKRSYRSPYDKPLPGDDVYDVYSLSSEVGINGIAYRDW